MSMLLGYDILVRILLSLGWESLLQARRVCKEWRAIIKSAEFKALWRPRSSDEDRILLTAYTSHWQQHPRPLHICAWSPKSRVVSPLPAWMKLPLPPGSFFDIVASSAGLVLIRQPSWPDRETPGVEFTVGNPATNEWIRIPRLDPQQAGRIYSMTADPATGEFKLLDNHNWRVYESSSRAWGPTLRMPDISETGELHDNTDTLGCLPFVWEHKGVHYRACAIADTYGKVTYKVWVWTGQWRGVASDVLDLYFDPMDGAGQWLGIASMDLDKMGIYTDWSMALECQAEGNLVCLAGQCRHCYDDGEKWADEGGEPLPPVVYDLDRDEWMYVRAKSDEGVQYRRAVVYRPSLVKPSGVEGAVALDPEGGEGHKRKREQQPLDTVARIRQHRMRAFGIEAEVYEDIFFMT